MPGAITGAPVLADLDGDEKMEIIVPTMQRDLQAVKPAHPQPDISALLWAFRADGTQVKGWPVVLLDENDRLIERNKNKDKNAPEIWFASPTVADVDNDDKDEIVTTIPSGGTRLIRGDGKVSNLTEGTSGDCWASLPAVDLNGDKFLDIVGGWVLTQGKGGPIPGWPHERVFQGGHAPCIGDAEGDGLPEVYHSFYGDRNILSGFDNEGQVLPGWPQKVAGNIIYPLMGDVTGDDHMEVGGIDGKFNFHLWTWDGQKLPGTRAIPPYTSIMALDVPAAHNPPALADLNGDGKAEIILFDGRRRAIRAWTQGATEMQTAGGPLISLPKIYGWPSPGVTVADLGSNGEMDIFCGTYWIRRTKDGATKITEMLPVYVPISTEVTIADVDSDGTAEAIFGSVNGKLFIYQTNKTLRPDGMHWITRGGNFQHTACWQSPRAPLNIN